jgi:hypothetical protein
MNVHSHIPDIAAVPQLTTYMQHVAVTTSVYDKHPLIHSGA